MTTDNPRFLALVAKVDEEITRFDMAIEPQEKEVSKMVDSINHARMRSFWADPPLSGFHYELKELNNIRSTRNLLRALKVAIMAHGPVTVPDFFGPLYGMPSWAEKCKCGASRFPCKPWLDIESEVGK